jgi:hypothetical protein
MSLTPAQRKLRARLAGFTSWANTTDRRARTAPATAAHRARAAARRAAAEQVAEAQLLTDAELAAEARRNADAARAALAALSEGGPA